MPSRPCAICQRLTHDVVEDNGRMIRRYPCARCGEYRAAFEAEAVIPEVAKTPKDRAVLSYAVRRMPWSEGEPPLIVPDAVRAIVGTTKLPEPLEQIDNLVIWLGEKMQSGQYAYVNETYRGVIGVIDPDAVTWVLRNLDDDRLVLKKDMNIEEPARDATGNYLGTMNRIGFAGYALSAKGWERYRELKRSALGSRKAFMAMEYGHEELDRVVRDCFQPAVAQTNFTLKLLYEEPKAGVIDDQMRTELLTSRFTVADLTHENRGAYWEAGFAEGAGRPVIYTCKKGYIPKVHFDTNHHLIVDWDPDDLPKTAKKLKNTIRATLPAEAKLTDD